MKVKKVRKAVLKFLIDRNDLSFEKQDKRDIECLLSAGVSFFDVVSCFLCPRLTFNNNNNRMLVSLNVSL